MNNRYREIRRPDHPKAMSNGCVYEHILIAEAALGHYLPEDVEIHHVDEDRSNNARSNLVICQDHGYHYLLHTRARVVHAGGNPNTQKLCTQCRKPKDFSQFFRGRITPKYPSEVLSPRCKECARAYLRASRARRKLCA